MGKITRIIKGEDLKDEAIDPCIYYSAHRPTDHMWEVHLMADHMDLSHTKDLIADMLSRKKHIWVTCGKETAKTIHSFIANRMKHKVIVERQLYNQSMNPDYVVMEVS